MLQLTQPLFSDVIDRLVTIREQITVLQEQESELEELIKEEGKGRYPGSVVDALVFVQRRHYVHWKDLVQHMKIPRRIVARFTEPQDVTCLKLVPKRSWAKATLLRR